MAITYVGSFTLSAGSKSTNIPIPTDGKPSMMRIANIGARTVFVLPGIGEHLTAVVGFGMAIAPNGQVEINIGTATHLAFITFRGDTDLNIALGT